MIYFLMKDNMATGNYLIDAGLQEEVASYEKEAPYFLDINNITQPNIEKKQPSFEKWGLQNQEEYDLMVDVKNKGGSADDFKFILNDFRTKKTPDFTEFENKQVEQVEEDREGFDIGLDIAEGLQSFGKAAKIESKFEIDPTENETLLGSFKNSGKQLLNSLRFLGNLPGDTVELSGELLGLASNVVGTARSVKDIGFGLADKLGLVEGTEEQKQMVDAIGAAIEENFGTGEAALETITQNPLDAITAVFGGASLAKSGISKTKYAQTPQGQNLINKLEKVEEATNPLNIAKTEIALGKEAIAKPFEFVGGIGKTLTSKTSGLEPATLTQLFKNPDLVKSGLTKEATATKVKKAIETRIEDVSGLGKEYQRFTKNKTVAKGDDVLDTFIDKVQKVDTRNINKADAKALSEARGFVNRYANFDDITDTQLLSLRRQLDSILYTSEGIPRKLSPNGQKLVSGIREGVDNLAKDKIKGLKELDAKFAPEIAELKKVKSLIFDKSGTLKDDYIQTISNLLGKGKEVKLERIKKLVPEIENEIKALKALEDVEFAKGNKIGTYFQTATLGGGLGSAAFLADPLLAVATLMLTSPTVVSNTIRAAGYSAKAAKSILDKIKKGIKLPADEAIIVGKALQEQVKLKGAKLADDLADITGARSKLLAGEGALKAPMSRLEQAKELVKQGANKDEIWKRTGWEQGKDGKWRFEIDDNKVVIKKATGKDPEVVGDLIEHDELFKQYPEIKDLKVTFDKIDGELGSYNPDTNTINMSKKALADWEKGLGIEDVITGEQKGTLLHEIQHNIQKIEGFAGGTNELKAGGRINYIRSAGEVEARNVQNRLGLTAAEKKLKRPELSEGIPRRRQILADETGLTEPVLNDLLDLSGAGKSIDKLDMLSNQIKAGNYDDLITIIKEVKDSSVRREFLKQYFKNK